LEIHKKVKNGKSILVLQTLYTVKNRRSKLGGFLHIFAAFSCVQPLHQMKALRF